MRSGLPPGSNVPKPKAHAMTVHKATLELVRQGRKVDPLRLRHIERAILREFPHFVQQGEAKTLLSRAVARVGSTIRHSLGTTRDVLAFAAAMVVAAFAGNAVFPLITSEKVQTFGNLMAFQALILGATATITVHLLSKKAG